MFRIKLKQLREEKGYSQYSFAKAFGVAQSTIGGWESGTREPNFQTTQKLADFFGVSIDFLMGRDEPKKNDLPKRKGVRIPVLGVVPAGIPIEAIEEVEDYEEITEEMASTGEFFALRIKGNSMTPTINDGDIVIIRKQPDIDSGQVAIVMVNGDDATCKQVNKSSDGIILIPHNMNDFKPTFYSAKEIEELPVRIIGKVVELRRSFK